MGVAAVAVAILALASSSQGKVLLDGRFTKENFPTEKAFDNSQVYQTYIHGATKNFSDYTALHPSFKNPFDWSEPRGLRLTADNSSYWLPFQPEFRRTELIPSAPTLAEQTNTTAKFFYHMSVMQSKKNGLTTDADHQILFHEREVDYTQNFGIGYGAGYAKVKNFNFYTEALTKNAEGKEEYARVPRWTSPFAPNTWYNFVFELNYGKKTVSLYHSTWGNKLKKVVADVSVPRLAAGWFHMGIFKIIVGNNTPREDIYLSSIKVTQDTIDSRWGVEQPKPAKPYKPAKPSKPAPPKAYSPYKKAN